MNKKTLLVATSSIALGAIMTPTVAAAQTGPQQPPRVSAPTANGPSDRVPMANGQAEATSTDVASPTNQPVVHSADPAANGPQTIESAGASSNAAEIAQSPAVGAAEIIVTGSRITTAGYQQPTPVTVVGEATLQRDAKTSIGESIRELPAVGASASPNNGSGAGNIVAGVTGLDTVNLRQLGVTRTLVLFDGQRVVQSNVTGQIDIGTIPTALVQRIDVVTAGASAAWGSDAVSGVVNLVLNKSFQGIRGSAEYGDSYTFDHKSYRFQLAAGTGFDDDKGRVIVAANYLNSPDVIFANQRSWNHYTQLIDNPAYTAANAEPKFIHVNNVGLSQATTGGLITAGPLKGIQFVGPNATPTPFNFGIVSGPVSANGSAETLHPSINDLTVAYDTLSVFGYTSYKFADWLKASVQLNYGETNSRNNSVPAVRLGNLTIRNDNAYLPASIKAQMAAAGVTTVPFGTTNMNNINPDGSGYSLDSFANDLGIPVARTNRKLRRGVFSLDGSLGGDWTWNAYYQEGKVKVYQTTESNIISSNYALAIDAVVAPAGNAAGIAAGTVVCRSTLTAPTNGCVPLNIFGNGVASQAAIDYVNVQPGQNFQIQRLTEKVVAASVQGTLPFGFAAGDIAVAFGAEKRSEKGIIENDAGAKARIYSVGNFPSFFGKYDVKEAFAEIDVPILKDSFVDSLSFNAAARVTNYSTSGSVTTWKVGALSQINSDLRIRGTVSRDIRAPNLNELFSTGLSTLGSAVDPKTGLNVSIFTFASGNPALTPEVAKTYSGGVVLRPSWFPRFSVSLDYYNINLKGAISSIGSAEVLSRCNSGQTAFCSQLVFSGPAGALSQINTFPQNVAALKTSGLDFQADYSFPALGGDVALKVLSNYILKLSQDQLGVTVQYAGAIGPDNPVSGFPRARATASATWSDDSVSATVQGRLIGASKLVYNWTSKDVDDNTVPAIFYVDARAQYEVVKGVQIFGTVDNLFNIDPPNVAATPSRGQTAYYFTAVRGDIHDTIGRSYRAGVRFRF